MSYNILHDDRQLIDEPKAQLWNNIHVNSIRVDGEIRIPRDIIFEQIINWTFTGDGQVFTIPIRIYKIGIIVILEVDDFDTGAAVLSGIGFFVSDPIPQIYWPLNRSAVTQCYALDNSATVPASLFVDTSGVINLQLAFSNPFTPGTGYGFGNRKYSIIYYA